MSFFEKQTAFLEELVKTVPTQQRKFLKSASEEDLKAISEIFLNYKILPKDIKCKRQISKLSKIFNKKRLSLAAVRKHFLKNYQLIVRLIATILAKAASENFTVFLSCDGNNNS